MAFIPAPVEDPRAACPVPVRRPCMIHEWNELYVPALALRA
ncbi:MAG: hypothetical protein R2699_19595 [Acidimicrobiales bacterium]